MQSTGYTVRNSSLFKQILKFWLVYYICNIYAAQPKQGIQLILKLTFEGQ